MKEKHLTHLKYLYYVHWDVICNQASVMISMFCTNLILALALRTPSAAKVPFCTYCFVWQRTNRSHSFSWLSLKKVSIFLIVLEGSKTLSVWSDCTPLEWLVFNLSFHCSPISCSRDVRSPEKSAMKRVTNWSITRIHSHLIQKLPSAVKNRWSLFGYSWIVWTVDLHSSVFLQFWVYLTLRRNSHL